jgi:hypothetical protein
MNALIKTSWSVSDTFHVPRIHADHFEGDQLGGSWWGFDYVSQTRALTRKKVAEITVPPSVTLFLYLIISN